MIKKLKKPWTCKKCERVFEKREEPHSCKKVPLEAHFKNKDKAKELFGKYDFLAALPKNEKLEIRFSLNRKIDSSRLIQVAPISTKNYENCIEIDSMEEINEELVGWLNESIT
jgi:hypothetical protein